MKREKYPQNWGQIRAQILERAKHKCEWCGVPNYAVGHRDATGEFHPTCGNLLHDAAGRGELSYGEAREIANTCNEWLDGMDGEGAKGIVIVLTIAHVHDPDPMNCARENLAALCQRCHLRHDTQHHARNARATRAQKRRIAAREAGQLELLEP